MILSAIPPKKRGGESAASLAGSSPAMRVMSSTSSRDRKRFHCPTDSSRIGFVGSVLPVAKPFENNSPCGNSLCRRRFSWMECRDAHTRIVK